MKEKKYNYNPKTLEYEEVGFSRNKYLLFSAISILIGSIFIFLIIFISYSYYYKAKIINNQESEYSVLAKQYGELLQRKNQNDKYLSKLIEKDKKIYQIVFKSNPDNDIFENKNPYSNLFKTDVVKIIRDNDKRLIEIKSDVKSQENNYDKIIKYIKNSDVSYYNDIPAIQPVYNKKLSYPVYGFGKRIDQVYKTFVEHPGIDYAVPIGTPVFATANGVVEKSGRKRGLGKRIIINHKNGYKTIYAHLDNINVNKGKKVKRGDRIGTVGMTGKTLIPHLHYEIDYNGKAINPVNYFFLDLTPEEFYKIRIQSAKLGLSLD